MRAAIGETDVARPLRVDRGQRLLQRAGAFAQLLRFLQQQIAAAVDPDVLQLIGVAAQPVHLARILREFRLLCRIVLRQQMPRPRVRMRVEPRRARPQEQRPRRAGIEEAPVVAGDHHRHAARTDPAFQHLDLREIQMVGRLVEQQRIRLGHPGAGDQRQPLPAAAQRLHRTVVQVVRRTELVEHDSDAPFAAVALRRRQRAANCLGERQVQQVLRHVLLDVADAHAARADDVADSRLGEAGQASQQRGLAAAVAGDQTDAVCIADRHGEALEQGKRRQHADIAQIDGRHGVSLGSWERDKGRRSEPAGGTQARGRQFRPLASPATMCRRAQTGPRG